MKDFSLKLFVAAVSLKVFDRNINAIKEMYNSDINVLYVPPGKDKADKKIEKEIKKFWKEYGTESCTVLISDDTGFLKLIKECESDGYKNFVLIYKDANLLKIEAMAKKSLKIPLAVFFTEKRHLRKRKLLEDGPDFNESGNSKISHFYGFTS